MRILILSSLVGLFFVGGCSSLITRNHYSIQKNVIYKTVDGANLTGDVYLADSKGPKPAVVVVHGGSWKSRAGYMTGISSDLARSGFVVFNITYRLVPEALYPKSSEDVRDAIQYLYDHADQYQIDREKIAAWGYSAGSQLVLHAGLDPKNHIKAIVAGGTPADFSAWPQSPIVTPFIGHTMAEREDLWKQASPVNNVQANSPPVFLYHGRIDHLVEVEQMYKMRDALKAKNIEVQTHEVKWMGHIAVYLFSQKSIDLGVEFIRSHLNLKD